MSSSMRSLLRMVPSWRDLGVSNLVEQRLEPCSMYSFRVTTFDAYSFLSDARVDPPSHAHVIGLLLTKRAKGKRTL
jgi:hypothetical protein